MTCPCPNAADKKIEPQENAASPPAPSPGGDAADAPKTTGEKFYDFLQFSVGKVAIMAATAGLAYTAKYGKDKYGKIPNYLKQFQGWMHGKLLDNPVLPLGKKGETGERLAGAIANTMVLFHGGNAFAPFMKWLENSHERIAGFVNRNFGKPGEEQISHERLKDKPYQNWGDIIKGRMAAWALVFSSFAAADALVGKDKKTGLYKFDWYEEWFGRKLAGLTKAGKAIGEAPVGTALTAAQDANKAYRFGKILALDVYATTIAILIWNFVSRDSAKKRTVKDKEQTNPVDAGTVFLAAVDGNKVEKNGDDAPAKRFGADAPSSTLKTHLAKPRPDGFADMLAGRETDSPRRVGA